ncbi:GIY-YIG nuclease family protein [Legionella sp. 28fT52]|uniref:GIY-YIG nuclease family protein n=3 Tax=Legionella TaxID=445 RepID=UPI003AF5BFC1
MKSGYLYVLTHPSDINLFKIGQTTRDPLKRLAEHNSNYKEYTGRLVKETGQKWEIKTYIEVPDPYWAESVFWGSTPLADIPFLGGIEVHTMEWEYVQRGLDAAKNAGLRPSPKELPDHIYAYTAWMRKRLEGRDITLLGYVRSKFGKATFRCGNGHEWRTRPDYVAEGQGCTLCGIGEKEPQEMRRLINSASLDLLTHPDKPGFIKIMLVYDTLDQCLEENDNDGWVVHRSRNVEEGPELAEVLIWELLGVPKPNNGEQIEIDERIAEQAFRDLIYRIRHEIALIEKEKEKRFQLI